jgi:hypothetical protein
MFRVQRTTFRWLQQEITPFLAQTASGKTAISVEQRHFCTLRYLAGGSFWDIRMYTDVQPATWSTEDGAIWPVKLAFARFQPLFVWLFGC